MPSRVDPEDSSSAACADTAPTYTLSSACHIHSASDKSRRRSHAHAPSPILPPSSHLVLIQSDQPCSHPQISDSRPIELQYFEPSTGRTVPGDSELTTTNHGTTAMYACMPRSPRAFSRGLSFFAPSIPPFHPSILSLLFPRTQGRGSCVLRLVRHC